MKKSLFALCLACLMAASVTACGDSNESSKSKKSKSDSSSVSQSEDNSKTTDESVDETLTPDSSESEPESSEDESEAEPQTDNRFAYYELLDSEYQQYGKIMPLSTTTRYSKNLTYADGCRMAEGYMREWIDGSQEYVYYGIFYDQEGNYNKIKYPDLSSWSQGGSWLIHYINGTVWADTRDGHLLKINARGELEKDINIEDMEITAAVANGDVILYSGDWDNGKYITKYYLLKSDSDKPIEITIPVIEGEHGLPVEEDNFRFIPDYYGSVSYKNKIYAYAMVGEERKFYYLDCNDLTWHSVSTDLLSEYITIGRYLFVTGSYTGSEGVYDMETDTITDEIPLEAYKNYYGGNGSIVLEGGTWVKKQYDPVTSSWVTIETLGNDDTDPNRIVQMSSTHYAVIDSYGIFIRTYEKGKDEEKTVLLFDNDFIWSANF